MDFNQNQNQSNVEYEHFNHNGTKKKNGKEKKKGKGIFIFLILGLFIFIVILYLNGNSLFIFSNFIYNSSIRELVGTIKIILFNSKLFFAIYSINKLVFPNDVGADIINLFSSDIVSNNEICP